ncbi:MAG: CoA transferase [Gammaproteobacteria bacterium]|nr:CoA transferase [Gammaproteobacteria bacterium]
MLVIDAATFLAGLGAATVLGDCGATVLKIEPPEGDRYRTLKGSYDIDYNWLLTSRNKKSIAIDLKCEEGVQLVHDLVAIADVFVTNFIGEHIARYQYEYERLIEMNPRLIYAHVTGFGTKGPDVERRSFDATAWWASSGLMEFVRDKDVKPVSSAPGMGDHATSMSLFSAIACALYKRERTGKGSYVSTSLLANGIWSNGMALQGVIAGMDIGSRKQATGLRNPFSSVYETRDGAYVLFSIVNAAREWPLVARALDREEWLDDPRFSSLSEIIAHRFELIDMTQARIQELTLDELLPKLVEYEITHSHVKPMAEVVNDEQALANEIIVNAEPASDDYPHTIMSPIAIADEVKVHPRRAPLVGADTIDILSTHLERSTDQIEALLERGVVFTEQQPFSR